MLFIFLSIHEILQIKKFTIVHLLYLIDMPEDGEVRLYHAYYNSDSDDGRLEVFLSSVWGTVAGPWTQQIGAVVCRQMGFEGAYNMSY